MTLEGLKGNLYEIQKDFIEKAKCVIENNEIGIFSSPTGTGKTISLLLSVYNYFIPPKEESNKYTYFGLNSENKKLMEQLFGQSDRITKVFYCSRTHTQLNQAINELKRFDANVNSIILGSRKLYCVNKKVNKTNVELEIINEQCKALISKNDCEFYCNFESQNETDIIDIEELIKKGKEKKFCPYYFAKIYSKKCEIVFLPYTVLFSKEGRRSANIDISDSIIIVDEAHNIYESVIQMNTVTISFEIVKKYFKAFEDYYLKYESRMSEVNLKRIKNICEILEKIWKFHENFANNLETKTESSSQEKNEECIVVNDFLIKSRLHNYNLLELEEYLHNSGIAYKLEGFNTNLHLQLFNITKFLVLLIMSDCHGRIFYDNKKIRFTPLDPKIYFEDIFVCKSLILAGGTMEPIDNLLNLFKERTVKYYYYDSICTNFISFILSTGPSNKEIKLNYKTRESPEILKDIVYTIFNLSNTVKKGGIICFLPSKYYLKILKETIINLEKNNFKFIKKILYDDTSSFLEFKNLVFEESVIFFSVMGGKMSEGINFNDYLCRLLIIIGIPYPTVNTELKERIKYHGNDYSTLIAMKTVNQALGRALRHKTDYASIVLIDSRYNNLISKISPWIARKTRKYKFIQILSEIKHFLNKNL
ncbi:ATP-dependent DNA helicase [Hamiltosporidium magnivora]|uniref:ATP-dependent DNA helicase CHL1 n=1 Tax=Hamiltosporidium magnivora TaxID=148818 RepID=A0A4Q9LGW9_9MICR|nr:ATP-dependent DNA helicase [Hamiltosporidium magnivora]